MEANQSVNTGRTGKPKITYTIAENARKRYTDAWESGKRIPQHVLAAELGITQGAVNHLLNHNTWASPHVDAEEDARQARNQKLRALYAKGGITQHQLSERFGMSKTAVWRAINGGHNEVSLSKHDLRKSR